MRQDGTSPYGYRKLGSEDRRARTGGKRLVNLDGETDG